MPRYRSIPTEVDAEQWFPRTANHQREVPGVLWEPTELSAIDVDGVSRDTVTDNTVRPYVVTIHGQRAYLESGDYGVTEPDGVHHYPCKPGIFEKKYRPVESANEIEALLAKCRELPPLYEEND